MTCPKCGFTEWKSAALVHKEGIGSGVSAYTGAAVGVDGAGPGVSIHSGQSRSEFQSLQSKSAAPPELKKQYSSGALFFNVLFALGGIALLIMGHPIWGAVVVVVSVGAFFGNKQFQKADKEAQERHTEALAAYERTRMCLRCGEFYVVE